MNAVSFTRVADGIFFARTSPLDVNTSLVIGDESALVIDTLSTQAQAEALLAAVRALTPLPLAVLNTHAHFDHVFGNAVVAAGRPVWAHERAAADLRDNGRATQREWTDHYRDRDPDFSAGIEAVTIKIPDHVVRPPHRLDLGGRTVTVRHHGRGHTDGDVVATVDDAGVVFTGDLIEIGAPPGFGSDSYPLLWPEAVAAMLREAADGAIFVPGHGPAVGTDEVAAQHRDLARLAWLIREVHADGGGVEAVAADAPWPAEAIRVGVERGFAALDDPID